MRLQKNESQTVTVQCTQEGANNNYEGRGRASATQKLKLVIMLKGVLPNYVI